MKIIKKKSFTLIEMLIVIFILVLLIGIIVVIFQRGNYEAKTNDRQRKKDISEISLAIEAFKADNGHYPLINWGLGQHAYQSLGAEYQTVKPAADCTPEASNPHSCDYCYGSFGPNYSMNALNCMLPTTDPNYPGAAICSNPNYAKGFLPGTWLKFTPTGKPCDDLSLQLLGKAYLAKMPPGDKSEDHTYNPGWVTNGLKAYLDIIPQDPMIAKGENKYAYVCKDYCPSDGSPTADYDPLADFRPQLYRYLYNSYYDCGPEAINVGERYWMNAIMQLMENGDYDAVMNVYFYELGTANFFRLPRSQCY